MNSSSTSSGYFVLADISGYTSFMAGTELDHSKEILREILELLVNQLTPTLELVEVEGDAVFVYCPSNRIARGETLLELTEMTYRTFRLKRDFMGSRTTCRCLACRMIPTLDLKFIVHHGMFGLQQVAGKTKPVGSDINLSHRLLKNSIEATIGWRAYILLTEDAIRQMNIRPEGMREQVESYEHLVPVKTYGFDLHDRFAELSRMRTLVLSDEEADDVVVKDFHAPAPVVWEWLTDPSKRDIISKGTVHWTPLSRPGGRTGPGASNHCSHGKESTTETICDWIPFEYFSAEYTGWLCPIIMTFELLSVEKGTRVIWKGKLKSWVPHVILKLIVRKGLAYRKVLASMEAHMAESKQMEEVSHAQNTVRSDC